MLQKSPSSKDWPDKRRSVYRPDPDPPIVVWGMLALARFETHLCWTPSLDGCAGFVRMSVANRQLEGFERIAFQAAVVRNVSSVGSQADQFPFRPLRAQPWAGDSSQHRRGWPSKLHELKQIESLKATGGTRYFRFTAGELRAAVDPGWRPSPRVPG